MTKFYIETLNFKNQQQIEAAFEQLLNESIDSVEQLEGWLKQQSELKEAIDEAMTGHYIDFQCHSESEEAKAVFEHDQNVIDPIYKKYTSLLNEKFLASPLIKQLNPISYKQLIKSKENAKALFRLENIDLEVQEDGLATNYFEHTGSLTVEMDGAELTLSQLTPFFQDSNREKREQAATLAADAFIQIEPELQAIMDQLIKIRHQKALNADLPNYRDYMFKKYERFDYSPEDCKQLAESIRKYVKPLKEKLQKDHQKELGLEIYKPWDRMAVAPGESPLRPFVDTKELIKKTASIFETLDPRFSELLLTMDQRGMLDLDSRKGKAPGGFCSDLPLSQLSFIFMNASTTHDDMITLLHEMGHCIHNDLMKTLPISDYRDIPMESAELASMSMELLTMDKWNLFYQDELDLKRAIKLQLKGMIDFLPQGMVIDQFQHWLYENPDHSAEERNAKYQQLVQELDSTVVDWSSHEKWIQTSWLRVLHIFEVPFYYIEYVIAQLGAIQMYKQYREDPKSALANYKQALSLGASKSLPEVYEAAGIRFDFSETMIKELMNFVDKELESVVL
ncbi:M3 family oligoendopeptidase [Halalkalibacter akibai]|uniref:Oligoendopeptidase F n=1 Tax=Halalkalibacter akibai (strain ATCC 43226 / DSM 21942 / CIP 109018 / JCM 9157 / 1139) TaxID=1236973 RepID=W4QY02_HALA3|nr:M3 family oligoendopeptidase [Halalkalibacter akibai]GAE36956.1 oligoendopeptidase F [Halalkalibacter akibai JCM 9157]